MSHYFITPIPPFQYVGGLDENVDEEVLQSAFIPFGEIVSILLPRIENSAQSSKAASKGTEVVGKHRGFGFVEFEETEDAKAAIENMHESELFGRIIKCNLANPKAARAQSVWAQADKWYASLQQTTAEIDTERRMAENDSSSTSSSTENGAG